MATTADPHRLLVLSMPRERLKLLVTNDHGDITIGFEGCPWHVHASMLCADYATEVEAEAAGQLIQDLFTGAREVVILRKNGLIDDAWISQRPDSPFHEDVRLAGLEEGENIQIRRWFA